MESLKPILLLIVLSGVGYGVYVALNHAPAPEPTSGATTDGNPAANQSGSPSTRDNHEDSPVPAAKSGSSGAGLGMSGILNPMGTATNAGSSAPRGNETRSVGPSSSLPFGIGSPTLRSSNDVSTPQNNNSSPGAASTPANDGNANSTDRAANSTANSTADAQARYEFEAARRNAQSMLTAGKLVEALRELSRWYGHPAVQPDEQAALVELLGQLAGSVIYSSQHWLLPAYAVRSGDTLESIAAQYDLPWQILAKINGIKNPSELTPGRELKVIRGPFQGQLDLSQQWLTVFVDGMYAGRFRVDARGQINKPEGWYPVVKFTAGNSPGTAATGPRHITVGGDIQLLCPEEAGTGTPGSWLGAIHIARPDMDDVFDILSERSQVTIRR